MPTLRKTLRQPNQLRGKKNRGLVNPIKGISKFKSPEFEAQSTLSQFTNTGSNSNLIIFGHNTKEINPKLEARGFSSNFELFKESSSKNKPNPFYKLFEMGFDPNL